jgi:hypothetical protein
MSANLDRLSRDALQLSVEEKMQLVETVLESLGSDAGRGELGPEETKRLGELWDEGIASGPGESLPIAELIARARSSSQAN